MAAPLIVGGTEFQTINSIVITFVKMDYTRTLGSVLLDNGEECVCPQSITYSLICKWFRAAVLPLDAGLCAALLYRANMKKCVLCGGSYLPKSNRAKYCPDCAAHMKRAKATERKRRQRQKCHALGLKKPL